MALDRLVENPDNPREDLSEKKVASLAESIRTFGILQPIIVTPHEGDTYMVRAGHRRLAAARLAELNEVPVSIVESETDLAVEIALQENLQREDLSFTEEAKALGDLQKKDYSIEELAELAGRSVVYIRQRLSLAELDPKVLDALDAGTIRFGHAVALSRIRDHTEQRSWLKKTLDRGMGVEGLRKELAGWRHDGFAFAAGEVTTCKHCQEPQPRLFEDEKESTSPVCSDEKHLVREDDRYRDRVGTWAKEKGIEVRENPQSWRSPEAKLKQGEPPFRLPKGTKSLVRHTEWRAGEHITTGWEPSNRTTPKAEKTTGAGSGSRTRSIEEGRRRAAREAVQRHLTLQISSAKALSGNNLKVARSRPQVLAFAIWDLLDHAARDQLVESLNLAIEEINFWNDASTYRYLAELDDTAAWEIVRAQIQIILLNQNIPVMADALERYLGVDPLSTYEADPEDLKKMKKDELRTVVPEGRIEDLPKTWSKGKHVDALAGATQADLEWPELVELLTSRIDEKATE